jgi:hypothetical protein
MLNKSLHSCADKLIRGGTLAMPQVPCEEKTSGLPVSLRNTTFWFVATCLYLTIAYSTSLQFVYGPEHTIEARYFTRTEGHALRQYYPDIGSCAKTLKMAASEQWKLTSFWGDSCYYLLQSKDPSLSIAPYRYRVLVPTIVRFVHSLTGVKHALLFVGLNLLTGILAALLLTTYLKKDLGFSPTIALFGGMLFLTSLPVTRVLPYPMLDMPASLWAILIVIAVKRRNLYLFLAASILGVATKEVLLALTLLWPLNMLDRDSLRITSRELWISVLAVALPLLTFAGIRMAFGASPADVNYGYNVLSGQFPAYWKRLVSLGGLVWLTGSTLGSYGIIWAGLLNVTKQRLFSRSVWVVPVVLLSTYLLSGQTARVLGPLFPVLIPMFLYFLEKPHGENANRSAGAAVDDEAPAVGGSRASSL